MPATLYQRPPYRTSGDNSVLVASGGSLAVGAAGCGAGADASGMGRGGAFDEVTVGEFDCNDNEGCDNEGIDAEPEVQHPPPPAWQQLGAEEDDGNDIADEEYGELATTGFIAEA